MQVFAGDPVLGHLVLVGVTDEVRVPRWRLHDVVTATDQLEILGGLLHTQISVSAAIIVSSFEFLLAHQQFLSLRNLNLGRFCTLIRTLRDQVLI